MIHTVQPDIHSYQNVTQEPFSSGDPSPLHYCKTLIAFLFGLMCQKAAGSSSSLSRGAHLASEEPRIPPPPACPSIAFLSSKPQQPSPHSHILSLFFSAFFFSSIAVFLSLQLSCRHGDAGFQRQQLQLWLRIFHEHFLSFCSFVSFFNLTLD